MREERKKKITFEFEIQQLLSLGPHTCLFLDGVFEVPHRHDGFVHLHVVLLPIPLHCDSFHCEKWPKNKDTNAMRKTNTNAGLFTFSGGCQMRDAAAVWCQRYDARFVCV